MLVSKSKEPKSTKGEEIKNEKVTPNGRPAPVKPIKRGIEEHEQKGVTVPRSAAKEFATSPRKRPNILLVRSGGKKLCMYEIKK